MCLHEHQMALITSDCVQVAARLERLLAASLERLISCDCAAGCSGCIYMPGCGDYNEGLEKPAALYILCR